MTGFLRALAERVAGEPHEWHAHVPARFEAVQSIALEDHEQAAGDAPRPALVLEPPPTTTAPAGTSTAPTRERPPSPAAAPESSQPKDVSSTPPVVESTAPTTPVHPLREQQPLDEPAVRTPAAARPVVRVTLDESGDASDEPVSAERPRRQPTPAPAAAAPAAARPAEPATVPSPAPPLAPRSTPTPLTPATPPRPRDRPDDDRRAPATPAPIYVRIGRVDVRAVMAPEPVAPVVRAPSPRRGPDLEEYLGSTGRPAL